MKKYICTACEYIYDPETGDPESGIAPGTAFEDIPDDWVCPLCGVSKDDFEPYEYQDSSSYPRSFFKNPHKSLTLGQIRRVANFYRFHVINQLKNDKNFFN